MARAKRVKCPECGDFFELDDYLEVGETTFCPMCDVALLIVELEPPLLKIAEEEHAGDYDIDENDDVIEDEEIDEDNNY